MIKKMIVMAIAILIGVTLPSYAEGNEANNVIKQDKYDFSVNIDKLASYLELGSDQKEMMGTVMGILENDMRVAAMSGDIEEREKLSSKAVSRNISYARFVLTHEQAKKYIMVLNATLNNKGIIIIRR